MFELPIELKELRSKIPVIYNEVVMDYREVQSFRAPEFHIKGMMSQRAAEGLAAKLAEKFTPMVHVQDEWDHRKFIVRGVALSEYELSELLYHAYTLGQDSALRSRSNVEWMK